MKLTVTQAARKWNKSKATLYNKMEDGILSYTIDENSGKRPRRLIDVCELVRVFGPEDQQDQKESVKQVSYPQDQISTLLTERINDLKEQLSRTEERLQATEQRYESRVRALEAEIKEKDSEILGLLKNVDGSLHRLLEHQTEEPEKKSTTGVEPEEKEIYQPAPVVRSAESKPKKGLLGRLLEAAVDI